VLELVKYKRFFSFASCLQCFEILPELLQPAGFRVPYRNLGDYMLFNVDLEHRKCLSARWPSATNIICRDTSVFNRKSILQHYLLLWCFSDRASQYFLFTKLMHSSFILWYMYYIKYLDMFRAILCPSSGGQNCIFTASGIVTLCERPCSAPVESGLQSAFNRCTTRPLTESDDTRWCKNTILTSWRWA
jgi:hypothetical protein